MPRDYLQRLLAAGATTPASCARPRSAATREGFWAELECAFLNTYQARWQYAADSLGLGFAQGKTMLVRRRDLARAGGIHALADEIAEDAAATKLVRGARPARSPGRRALRPAAGRAHRAAGLGPPDALGAAAPHELSRLLRGRDPHGLPAAARRRGHCRRRARCTELPPSASALAAIWLGCEALLARAAGWHLGPRSPLAWALRDALLPLVWMHAWLSDGYAWRGNDISTAESNAPAN